MPMIDKLRFILAWNNSSFGDWEKYYAWFDTDEARPEFIFANHYPSSEKPALIPLINRPVQNMLKDWKQKGLEFILKTEDDDEQARVISLELMLKFLSFTHLNTVVGLKSQAMGFSDSPDGSVNHLGIIPFDDKSPTSAKPNKYGLEGILVQCFGEDKLFPFCDKTFVSRCWIITHPTSNVFLLSGEILQLYIHIHHNQNCFCIILSPRNNGIKMVCVKLTKRNERN